MEESQSDRERTQLGVNFRILIEKDTFYSDFIVLVAISSWILWYLYTV